MSYNNEQVVEYLTSLDGEAKAIKKEALRFSWHMRGGLSYDDAMLLGTIDREIIADIIKEHMETTKESGLPFF